MGEYDETSEESSFFDLSNSLSSGVGDIFDGAVEVAKSAGALAHDVTYEVGHTEQVVYHSLAAGAAAFIGDMATASAENDTANRAARDSVKDEDNIRDVLGI